MQCNSTSRRTPEARITMSKTNTVASKFSDAELDKIDWFVQKMGTTRSALFHDLVMQGVSGAPVKQEIPKGIKDVKFIFKRMCL